MRWNIDKTKPEITWSIVADSESNHSFYGPAVEDSVNLWNEASGSYMVLTEATDSDPDITINLNSEIEGSAFSSGFSVFDTTDENGPTHCTIQVLVGPQEYGVAKTILHELGHCLGLGHSLVPEAIMSYSLDKNRFALDIDDQAAVARLYPADGSPPKLPLGCAIGSGDPILNQKTIFLLLIIPLILIVFRRREQL